MNYLEAEDDGHGPVPMEVGAMKGKKGDRGKKGYGKGKFGKILGKYDNSNEHSKRNDYSKGSKKGREIQKGKGKGQGKDEKTSCKFSVSKATAEHVEDGDTRRVSVGKDMCRAVEEVPSSSASSVAPSAANHTSAAAKTAASIQEFSVEQEQGWIFRRDGWISGISHNWYRQPVG